MLASAPPGRVAFVALPYCKKKLVLGKAHKNRKLYLILIVIVMSIVPTHRGQPDDRPKHKWETKSRHSPGSRSNACISRSISSTMILVPGQTQIPIAYLEPYISFLEPPPTVLPA